MFICLTSSNKTEIGGDVLIYVNPDLISSILFDGLETTIIMSGGQKIGIMETPSEIMTIIKGLK